MSCMKNQPCIHKGMSYVLYKKNQPCIHKGMAYVFYKKSALYMQRYGLCLV